ncbi:GntR family transcriptional regulator [Sphaerisporangium sp. NPDC051017]|uniref:GntR family transcriptional regulator n=1 Tax=Sphaerisporangium sp. NPDC051017 TaxID=3154636 RepID=UPI0034322D6D
MIFTEGILDPLDPVVPSLTERAVQVIRRAITTGDLIPGKLYSVHQLSKDLGVSRSPVRDALLRLEETGMVRFERNRGFRIVLPGARELAEIFGVRLALEVPAAAMAARRATDEQIAAMSEELESMRAAAADDDEPTFMLHDQQFHSGLLAAAGNEYARGVIDNIRIATRMVGTSTVKNQRSLAEVILEHEPILEAVAKRDERAAISAMSRHLRHTGEMLVQRTSSPQQDPIDLVSLWWLFVPEGGLSGDAPGG